MPPRNKSKNGSSRDNDKKKKTIDIKPRRSSRLQEKSKLNKRRNASTPKKKITPKKPRKFSDWIEDDDDDDILDIDLTPIINGILGGGGMMPQQPMLGGGGMMPLIISGQGFGGPSNENEEYLKSLGKKKRKQLKKLEKRLIEMNEVKVPLRYKIIESNLPDKTKSFVLQKVAQFEKMDPTSSGYFKMKGYMDKLLRVPFGEYKTFPIRNTDKPEKIQKFFSNIKSKLDQSVYGQEETKQRIIEIVAKWVSNPDSKGNIIGLCGPPGVGKTTLIKKGLAEAIDVPMAFVPLGGCRDSSTLEGYDYTYEGSKNGKLVDILVKNKCMNPIIFFDELDKVSDTKSGLDIVSILTHLTDFTQNDTMSDKYFSDIEFDFSRCLFVFSFNDETKINPILKDRLTIIHVKGFDNAQKKKIAKDFVIPKYLKSLNMDAEKVSISDDVIEYIIETYCHEEKGVRNLERCIEAILLNLNLFMMTRDMKYVPEGTEFKGDNLTLPKKFVKSALDKFFKQTGSSQSMMYS